MSFEDKRVYGLNIPHQMHLRANVNKHKIYHYSGGWYLWRSLVQSCEFGTINIHGVLSWTTWWPPSWNQTLITYCQKCSINLKVWNVDLFINFIHWSSFRLQISKALSIEGIFHSIMSWFRRRHDHLNVDVRKWGSTLPNVLFKKKCRIWYEKLKRIVMVQRNTKWNFKDKTFTINHVDDFLICGNLNQSSSMNNTFVSSMTRWIISKLFFQGL